MGAFLTLVLFHLLFSHLHFFDFVLRVTCSCRDVEYCGELKLVHEYFYSIFMLLSPIFQFYFIFGGACVFAANLL